MNDKTKQALTDALIDQIESAARASFRRHQSSIKGQILTAADNYDWHLLHAAYQAGIHAMRAQLAEAQAALKTVMRNAELSKEPCAPDPESPAAIRNGKFAGLASIAAQGLGMVRGPSLTEHLVEAQGDAEPAAQQGDNIAVRVCRSVAELPDRDSPEGWPEAMLVTHEELHAIVLGALNDDQPTTAATQGERGE